MKTSAFIPRCLLALAGAAFTLQAAAADWTFSPRVEVGGMADSNLRLDEGDSEGRIKVSGAFGKGELQMLAASPLSDISFTPRVEGTWFPDEDVRDEDYVNGGARLAWVRRGRKVHNNLRVNYDNSATVTGNRVTHDGSGELGDPDDVGDSGALSYQNRVQTLDVRDSLRIAYKEHSALEASAFYLNRDFDEQEVGEEVSFFAFGASLGWAWQVKERYSLGLRLRAQRYDPEIIPVKTNDLGFEAEWRYQVSEQVDSYIRLGAAQSSFDTDGPEAPDDVVDMVGGIGGSWRFQVSSVFLDLTRAVSPNSSGYTVVRNQLQFRLDRDFSERVRGAVAVRFIADEAPEGINERRYAIGSVGAEWRVSRIWSLLARYDYSWQDYDLTPGEAASNAVWLSLLYQPRRPARDSSRLLD